MTGDAFDQSGEARQLNAARGLLQRHVALPEAVQRLSRELICQSVKHIGIWRKRPSSIGRLKSRAYSAITLKLPPSTVERLRKCARSSG